MMGVNNLPRAVTQPRLARQRQQRAVCRPEASERGGGGMLADRGTWVMMGVNNLPGVVTQPRSDRAFDQRHHHYRRYHRT